MVLLELNTPAKWKCYITECIHEDIEFIYYYFCLLYERLNYEKIQSLEQDKSLLEARVTTLEQLIQEYQKNIETLKAEILKVSIFLLIRFIK